MGRFHSEREKAGRTACGGGVRENAGHGRMLEPKGALEHWPAAGQRAALVWPEAGTMFEQSLLDIALEGERR